MNFPEIKMKVGFYVMNPEVENSNTDFELVSGGKIRFMFFGFFLLFFF